MANDSLLTCWVTLSPFQRAVVREVYVRDRTLADTAARLRTGGAEVSRALLQAYRRVAAVVSAAGDDVRPTGVVTALTTLAAAAVSSWVWDTSREEMTWSDGLFELYGYPRGAVAPTIGVHQAHKQVDDRAVVEHLVMTAATEHGPVVFPQRIVRTDGSVRRVVMRVVRESGPGEVLVGRVVADAV